MVGKISAAMALAACAVSAPSVAEDASSTPKTDTVQPPDAANAQDPASVALGREILRIGFPPEKRSQLFASVMDSLSKQVRASMQTQAPVGDKEFQAIVDRSTQRMFAEMKVAVDAALPDYFESMAHAYARMFSKDDLNAILAFVKTPAGQHYLLRSASILNDPDVQAAGQRMSKQLLQKLPEIQRDAMADVEAYVAKKEKQEKTAQLTHTS